MVAGSKSACDQNPHRTLHHQSLGRARIIFAPPSPDPPHHNVSKGFERSLTVAQEEAVVQALQAWLSEMLGSSPDVKNDSDNP
jgi:hypothetical protein